MTQKCMVNADYTNDICPECGLAVDAHGNTEAQPVDYCAFPDCGCDGARNCQAGEASGCALTLNIEKGSLPDPLDDDAYGDPR